jgi:hypothetical protein
VSRPGSVTSRPAFHRNACYAARIHWELFTHRLPSEPSRARVGVWRELRRLGALPLAPSLVAVPAQQPFMAMLDAVEARVEREGGSSYRFAVRPAPEQEARLRGEWNALREHEYGEIVEECETKFLKEIEFELFRGNLTAGEAEEIEADLDKIRRWEARVRERDLFEAPGSAAVTAAIARCHTESEQFVERVYQAEERRGPILEAPEDLPWGEMPDGFGNRVLDLPRSSPAAQPSGGARKKARKRA